MCARVRVALVASVVQLITATDHGELLAGCLRLDDGCGDATSLLQLRRATVDVRRKAGLHSKTTLAPTFADSGLAELDANHAATATSLSGLQSGSPPSVEKVSGYLAQEGHSTVPIVNPSLNLLGSDHELQERSALRSGPSVGIFIPLALLLVILFIGHRELSNRTETDAVVKDVETAAEADADEAAAGKAVAEQAASDKAAADKAATDQVAAEKAAAEKAVADKAVADKAAAEKEAADKVATEKALADEAAAGKAAAEKVAANKATADKLAADQAAIDKASADKVAADKASADKASADKAAADKAAADKAAADKAAGEKTIDAASADNAVADKAVADSAVQDAGEVQNQTEKVKQDAQKLSAPADKYAGTSKKAAKKKSAKK